MTGFTAAEHAGSSPLCQALLLSEHLQERSEDQLISPSHPWEKITIWSCLGVPCATETPSQKGLGFLLICLL